MNTIIYFIQANLFLSVFFLFYSVLLKKETFHLQNRIYLISAVFISMALPFFQSIFLQKIAEPITDFQTIATVYTYTNEIATSQNISQKLSNIEIIKILYWAGVAISILILLIKTIRTIKWIKTCDDKKGVAFSFFSKIFIDKNLDLFEIVHEHEKIHVNQFHFIDILIFELLKIVFWFNPTVHYYKKAITIIHEFLADESASRQLFCKSEYATLLVSKQFQIQPSTLFTQHFFNQSTLKTRIEMLLKNPSRKTALLKYGFLAPLLFIMLLVSSFTVVKEENLKEIVINYQKINSPKIDLNPVDYVIKKDTLKPNKEGKEIFDIAETSPEFKGGLKELYKYLGENIKYPKEAQKANIEGIVFVKFVIEADGKIGDIKITKGVDLSLDLEAMRVVKSMPDWTPGIQNGKPVAVYYNMPISFRLGGKKSATVNTNEKTDLDGVGSSPDLKEKNDEKINKFPIGTNDSYQLIKGRDKVNYEKPGVLKINGEKTEALIFVNDMEIFDKNLNNIDPKNIESMSVIKDKEAIKTYGERGKNGVILIKTKK